MTLGAQARARARSLQALTVVPDGLAVGDVMNVGGSEHSVASMRRLRDGWKTVYFTSGIALTLAPRSAVSVIRRSPYGRPTPQARAL